VKETLSVARDQSRVGGSFLIVILKMEVAEDGLLEQPDRTKIKIKVKTSFGKIFGVQMSMKTRKN
tara:strand:+ start:553 stop:747 length:195 start_codon:yes stop_codon:yes gene_type:complete